MDSFDIKPIINGLNTKIVGSSSWIEALGATDSDLRIGRAIPGMIKPGWRTQRGPERSYRTHYLFFAPKASIRVDLEQDEYLASPGTLLWFAPGVPYHLSLDTDSTASDLYRFRFQLVREGESWSPFHEAKGIHPLVGYGDLFNQFDHEYRRARSELVHGRELAFSDFRWRGLLMQLSVDVFRALAGSRGASGGLSARQCGEITHYLYARMGQPVRPKDLAKHVGLSDTYFSKRFKQTYGVSPRKWLVEERIRYASDLLLEESLNVNELSQHLGYANVHLFSRQFKAYHGMGPLAFRKTH